MSGLGNGRCRLRGSGGWPTLEVTWLRAPAPSLLPWQASPGPTWRWKRVGTQGVPGRVVAPALAGPGSFPRAGDPAAGLHSVSSRRAWLRPRSELSFAAQAPLRGSVCSISLASSRGLRLLSPFGASLGPFASQPEWVWPLVQPLADSQACRAAVVRLSCCGPKSILRCCGVVALFVLFFGGWSSHCVQHDLCFFCLS